MVNASDDEWASMIDYSKKIPKHTQSEFVSPVRFVQICLKMYGIRKYLRLYLIEIP